MGMAVHERGCQPHVLFHGRFQARADQLCPTTDLSADGRKVPQMPSLVLLHGKGNFTHETFWEPIVAHFAFLLASNHPLHYFRAEALARWPLDWWAPSLGPAEDEPSFCHERPLNLDLAFGMGQRPVLGRIG
jgi:hypothetical protein